MSGALPAQPQARAAFEKVARGKAEKREFPAVWLADAAAQIDASETLKGLIGVGTLALIYGPSGSGKSFFTADLALHIACGIAWRARRVRQVLAVYVAAEAGASILKRFAPARDRLLGEAHEGPLPFVILTRGPNLLSAVDVEDLMAQLRALAAQAKMPLGLVAFDTLSRSIPGGDENRSEDMTMVIQAADRIRDEFGAATIIVHHSGKDASKGMRGHSALFAAADLVIAIDNNVATVEKVRDGVAGEQFPFRLEVIELGTDQDGDPVTTCLLHPAYAGAAQPKRRDSRLPGVARVGLQALQECIGERGERLPETSSIPPGVKGTTLEAWRTRFALRYGEDGASGDATRKAFQRAKEALQKHPPAIGISTPYVWTT